MVLLAVVLLIGMSSCVRRPVPVAPPVPPTPPAAAPSADDTPAALDAVLRYVKALDAKDTAAAYALLSGASRSQRTERAYARDASGTGMTPLDLSAATARSVGAAEVIVTVPFAEDPASHGYHAVKEDGQWHVVYRVGTPYLPSDANPEGAPREMPR